jgi:hypothetical protein
VDVPAIEAGIHGVVGVVDKKDITTKEFYIDDEAPTIFHFVDSDYDEVVTIVAAMDKAIDADQRSVTRHGSDLWGFDSREDKLFEDVNNLLEFPISRSQFDHLYNHRTVNIPLFQIDTDADVLPSVVPHLTETFVENMEAIGAIQLTEGLSDQKTALLVLDHFGSGEKFDIIKELCDADDDLYESVTEWILTAGADCIGSVFKSNGHAIRIFDVDNPFYISPSKKRVNVSSAKMIKDVKCLQDAFNNSA